MDPLRALPGVVGSMQVQERRGGSSRREADAFRRALQDGGQRPAAEQPAAPPPSGLQRRPGVSRKDDGKALHVDVIA